MPTWIYTVGIYAAIIIGGYFYYTTTQNKLEAYAVSTAKYELAIQTNNETIQRLEDDAEERTASFNELSRQLDISEAYQDSLHELLQKHDLTRLTIAKPGLIENRMNDATKQIYQDMESDTSN